MKKARLALQTVLICSAVAIGFTVGTGTASAENSSANTSLVPADVESILHQFIAGSGLADTGSSLNCPFWVDRIC